MIKVNKAMLTSKVINNMAEVQLEFTITLSEYVKLSSNDLEFYLEVGKLYNLILDRQN